MSSSSSPSSLDSLKIKAKLLQKAKARAGKPIALKDALDTIAKLTGFTNWRELKANADETDVFSPPGTSAHWKTWWASYEDACGDLAKRDSKHYLMPYRKQFFICDADYVAALGISADDSDLKLVGQNWVEPSDKAAWTRLRKKLKPIRL